MRIYIYIIHAALQEGSRDLCEPVLVPPAYRAAADAALLGAPGGAPPRVAVAGAKGSGKSTLSRYIYIYGCI